MALCERIHIAFVTIKPKEAKKRAGEMYAREATGSD
jgi:hypothetical protein